MKKIFIIFIFISFYSSAKAQATLTFEKAIRPLASGLTNSEGNTIVRDAFQLPTGLAFSNDGRKVFSSNFTSNGDHECISMMTLKTPFDLRTVSRVVDEASPLVEKVGLTDDSNDTKCSDIKFSRDGLKLFLGNVTGKIHGFDLAKPFDLNGLTYSNNVTSDLTDGNTGGRANFSFSNDGKKLIFLDGTREAQHIDEYKLSTAYDLTSITLLNTITLTTTANLDSKDDAHAIEFSQDGLNMFVLMHDANALNQTDKDAIFQFRLTQPFSTSTATILGSVTPSGTINTAAFGMAFSPSGNRLYLVNRIGSQDSDKFVAGGSVDVVTQVGLSCNFGIFACVSDPRTGVSTQIQLAKNNVSENSSVIFKRFEWIKRNRDQENLTSHNININYPNPLLKALAMQLQPTLKKNLVSLASKSQKKEKKSKWSYWSLGDLSMNDYLKHGSEKAKSIKAKGLTFGADRKFGDNKFFGLALRYGRNKSNIFVSQQNTEMDSLTLNFYGIIPIDEDQYVNAVLGLSALRLDNKYLGKTSGERNGKQAFASLNYRTKNTYGKLNITPTGKFTYGVTRLSEFTDFLSSTIDSPTTDIIYAEDTFKSGELSAGFLFEMDKFKGYEGTFQPMGAVEIIYDLTPDVDYKYKNAGSTAVNKDTILGKYSRRSLKTELGFEWIHLNGFTVSPTYERIIRLSNDEKKNELLSERFIVKLSRSKEEDKSQFALNFDPLSDNPTKLTYVKNLNGFDIKINSNYNLSSKIPDYGANIEVSSKF